MAVPKSEYSTNFDAAAAKKSMGHYQRINILFAFTLGMMAFLESVIGVIREIRREFLPHRKTGFNPGRGWRHPSRLHLHGRCSGWLLIGLLMTIIKRLIANLGDYPRNAS